jgi:hypothetical protein
MAANITGTWEMTTVSQRGERKQDITFKQDGEKLTVSWMQAGRGGGDRVELEGEGTVKGNDVEWKITRTSPRGDMTTLYKGTIVDTPMKAPRQEHGRRDMTSLTAAKAPESSELSHRERLLPPSPGGGEPLSKSVRPLPLPSAHLSQDADKSPRPGCPSKFLNGNILPCDKQGIIGGLAREGGRTVNRILFGRPQFLLFFVSVRSDLWRLNPTFF